MRSLHVQLACCRGMVAIGVCLFVAPAGGLGWGRLGEGVGVMVAGVPGAALATGGSTPPSQLRPPARLSNKSLSPGNKSPRYGARGGTNALAVRSSKRPRSGPRGQSGGREGVDPSVCVCVYGWNKVEVGGGARPFSSLPGRAGGRVYD